MASNSGKVFENEFQKSLSNKLWCYRFRDGTSSWSGGTNTRFQSTNICDFEVYNPYTRQLFYLELKTVKGVSIPFNNIKDNQIEGLLDSRKYGIISGLLINMNSRVYWLDIIDFVTFKNTTERKSLPLEYLKEKGLFIPSHKLQKYYRYDLDKLFEMRSDRIWN